MNHIHTSPDGKQQKDKILVALKKANSLTTRLIKMVESDQYCIDTMQQNAAAIGLLKSTQQMLMEDHLHSCFNDAVHSNNDERKSEMVEEILKVSKLASK